MTDDLKAQITEVLVRHQRKNSRECLCGWGHLGRSHAAHVADAIDQAAIGPELERLRKERDEQLQRAGQVAATIERAKEAERRLAAALIASAHLLDQPFSNAPDLSPWTRSIKPAMNALRAALISKPAEENSDG